jgi:hypothetical protein
VKVNVKQTATSIAVAPHRKKSRVNKYVHVNAVMLDQFGHAMRSLTSVGSIHSDLWRGKAVDLASRGYLAVWHRLEIRGQANLPKKPPFVRVANHASHLDAFVLAAALRQGEIPFGFTLATT